MGPMRVNQATGLPPELPYSCSPHAFISEVRRVRFYGGIVTRDTWTRRRGFLGCTGEKVELAYEFLCANRQIRNYRLVTSP
jgi:hypothetical protein